MNSGQTQTIRLTIKEGALLLEALGARPFKEVFDLIGRINHAANEHTVKLVEAQNNNLETSFAFTRHDLDLMIRALAELPFNQVHNLMAKLHSQLQAQGNGGQQGNIQT